ncbi:hypothetical protein [Actinoplanes sp. L3-i22]|uniref:hypothetical protein n=1 Tax=Actinoplanes sp. L3-i22 TaxID=2836373 RepID=UPI001C85196A|nr:hypothetical protein [Actinoplanes sp. L3-i22]
MTAIPAKVQTGAEGAELGVLIVRMRHPNAKGYAFAYGLWLALLGSYLIGLTVILVAGNSKPVWAVTVPLFAALIALLVWLAAGMIGSLTRRAFYLYEKGYVVTTSLGRAARVARWTDVTEIQGATGPYVTAGFGRRRVLCRIVNRYGRAVRFAEPLGHQELAPLAERLRRHATGAAV